jgi:predicted RNase H-like HicB family nuclease
MNGGASEEIFLSAFGLTQFRASRAAARNRRRLQGRVWRIEDGVGLSIHAGAAGVRFLRIPEAPTEGETEEEARTNAVDCVIAALEGYIKAGKPLPRDDALARLAKAQARQAAWHP